MAPVQLVGAVGAYQEHPRGARGADQEGDQVTGRAVGPVQVLDDEHERVLRGLRREETGDEVEQVTPVVVGHRTGRTKLREEPGEVGLVAVERRPAVGAQHLAQHGGERRERQPFLAQLEALAGEDPGTSGTGVAGELVDQPGLADAGLAAHEHGGGLVVAGALERLAECGELGLAPHEDGTGPPRGHGNEHAMDRVGAAAVISGGGPERGIAHDSAASRRCHHRTTVAGRGTRPMSVVVGWRFRARTRRAWAASACRSAARVWCMSSMRCEFWITSGSFVGSVCHLLTLTFRA
jgi:hypothetical protein